MSDLRRTLTNNRRRLLSERPGSIDIDQGEGANLIDNEEIASSLPTDYSIGRFLENEVVPIRPNRSFVINDSNSMGRDRLPYHVPASMPAFSRAESVVSLTSMDRTEYNRQQNMAIRYRLFNALDPGGSRLTMPDHILPNEFFSILPFDDFNDESGKQGSIVTIFSIWNTMMGTSLLAMPWALGQAGFALGSFLILLMAAISLYTAYRVIQSPNGLILPVDSAKAEVSDVCRYFWGSAGEYVSVFVSIITLVGGILVYWVLMSNFLFYTVNVFHDAIQPNSSTIPSMANKTFKCDVVCPDNTPHQNFKFASFYLHPLTEEASFWDYKNVWSLQGTVPIVLAFLVFPLMNFKSPTFFTKFNMLGTISVMYLIVFTISKSYECGFNLNFSDTKSEHYAPLWSMHFPSLTGTLALSYFIHNAILTILRNQKNPSNNARDLSIGYCLSATCYMIIGVLFYASFPTIRSCLSDNFLNNFGSGDVMSATARLFLLFQMITVLPLLMYFVRSQFFYVVKGITNPSTYQICCLNLFIIVCAVIVAIFYPHVGSILRYVGAFSGLIYVFALPCALYLKKLHIDGKVQTKHIIIHGTIVTLGLLNLFAQFFV